MVVLGSPDPQSAVHCEEGHGGSFDPQQQRTAGGLCLVEGVGNGDHQVYQNDQGVEKSVVLMDVESFNENTEFEQILGYINTAVESQKKGVTGDVK